MTSTPLNMIHRWQPASQPDLPTLLLRPDTLQRAVLFHLMVPLEPDQMPDLRGRQVFIGAGRHDTMTPPEQAEQLAAMPREAGADVTMHWQAGGHELTLEEIEAARDWLG